MKMFRIVAAYTLLVLIEATAGTDLVILEAMCSSDSAGVRWTIPAEGEIRYTELSYRCHNSTGEVLLSATHTSGDPCFHKNGGLPPLNTASYRSMTHIVGGVLQPGTVCTFTMILKDKYFDSLGQEMQTCTVGAEGSLALLPANCTVASNNQECQCSCSPGLDGRDDDGVDGTTCEEILVTESSVSQPITSSSVSVVLTSLEVTPTSMMGISYTRASLSSGDGLSMPIQTSLPSLEFKSLTSTVISTPTTSILPPAEHPLFTSSPSTVVNSAPPTSQSPPPTTPPTRSLPDTSKLVILCIIAAPVSLTLIGLGVVCAYRRYKRCKRQRLHEKLALPFTELKLEKINPDFNPVKIEKPIFVYESMQSIFNTLGSLDPNYATKSSEQDCQNDSKSDDSSSMTESNSLSSGSMASGNFTESEETILKENKEINLDEVNTSGYLSETIIQETNNYIRTELAAGNQVLPLPEETATLPPFLVDEGAENDGYVNSIDSLTATNYHSNTVSNLERGCQIKASSVLGVQAVDYVAPICTPQVFFSFPEDMQYVNNN